VKATDLDPGYIALIQRLVDLIQQLCGYCAGVSRYTDSLLLVAVTEAELQAEHPDLVAQIREMQGVVRMKLQRRGPRGKA
jgi:hypothetical protein